MDQFGLFHWSKNGEEFYFQYTKVYSPNDLKYQFFRVNVFTKEEELIKEIDWEQDHSLFKVIPKDMIYFNQQNNPIYEISNKDLSNHKTTSISRGSLYFNNKELLHFKWWEYKFNSGFFNPRWLPGQRYIIFYGPKLNLPLLSFKTGEFIYIADSETGKIGRLNKGHSFGWYDSFGEMIE